MLIHVMESSSVLLSRRSKCFKHFVCTIDRIKCSLVVSDAGKNLDIGPLDISKDSVKSRWKEITYYFISFSFSSLFNHASRWVILLAN